MYHGNSSTSLLFAAPQLLPAAVRRVQVVHVEDHAALEQIAVYAPYVHAFLLDSGRPSAPVPELACIGHKSLEICARCRLWQRNSPATPENSAAFWIGEFNLNSEFKESSSSSRIPIVSPSD